MPNHQRLNRLKMRQFLRSRIGTLFTIGLLIYAFFIMKPVKRPPPEKPNWIFWDLVNGRGITARDTHFMTRHPNNRDEWVTKAQADSIRKSIRFLPEFEKKSNTRKKSGKASELEPQRH